MPINKNMHNIEYRGSRVGNEKVNYIHEDLDLKRNLPSHYAHTNIKKDTGYQRRQHENDIVLDCFAGSGSMGYACLETNRKCILIEKDVKYCNYIESELNKK
jgi:predicted RNA methylase